MLSVSSRSESGGTQGQSVKVEVGSGNIFADLGVPDADTGHN
jgi:hypothetical protein